MLQREYIGDLEISDKKYTHIVWNVTNKKKIIVTGLVMIEWSGFYREGS